MITTNGKNHIRRYMAGYVPAIAGAIALGIGANTETLADTALAMEVARAPLTVIRYDFAADEVVFKAEIPEEYVGKIYEVGLFSLVATTNDFGSRLLTTFDSSTEGWTNPADDSISIFDDTAVRVGLDALKLAPPASNTYSASLKSVGFDLSGFSGADAFIYAFAVADNNTNAIVFKYMTDASNYYSITLGAQTSGYKITQALKSTATTTGTPNWAEITEIQVSVTAKSGGATSVEFDAMRIEDKDSVNLDYVLVARKVLVSPKTKVEGQPQDIEYSLAIAL